MRTNIGTGCRHNLDNPKQIRNNFILKDDLSLTASNKEKQQEKSQNIARNKKKEFYRFAIQLESSSLKTFLLGGGGGGVKSTIINPVTRY